MVSKAPKIATGQAIEINPSKDRNELRRVSQSRRATGMARPFSNNCAKVSLPYWRGPTSTATRNVARALLRSRLARRATFCETIGFLADAECDGGLGGPLALPIGVKPPGSSRPPGAGRRQGRYSKNAPPITSSPD